MPNRTSLAKGSCLWCRVGLVLACISLLAWLPCCSGNVSELPDSGTDDAGLDAADGQDGGADGGIDGGADADDGGQDCIDLDEDGLCREIDCDDRDATIGPGLPEVCGNAIDDDCDGLVDEDCPAGDTFYVDVDSIGGPCSDDGPGSLGAPWCSVAKANASLQAGQTVYLRAGTYVETISPANSGASDDARIVYAAYGGEAVTFTTAVYCVRLQGNSYITIRGIRFYDCERNLYLSASHHNNVIGCEFDTPAGPATWAGSRIYDGSTYNRITHCTFSRYGEEQYYANDYQDYGCNLDIGNDNSVDESDHNLVAHNTFFYGGHHILGVYANYNVVRDNTFHNEEWFTCHRAEIGGLCGGRNVILNTSQPDTNTRNLIEDNVIAFAGVPPDQVSSAGLSLRTQHNIVRRNIFSFCDSSGVALSHDGGAHNDASHNYIYNNVFYSNGYLLLDDWNTRKNGLLLARWVDDAEHLPMTGVAIKNNIFHENNLQAIAYYYVDEQDQDAAANWEEAGDPGFVALSAQPDPFDLGAHDFHLRADSPCIDQGDFLAQTTNSGTHSTSLQVDQAGYFTDGHDLIAGDIIQLEGQATTARIVAVDYAANEISLDRPLSWEPGLGVNLAYFGQRPDQGAFESAPDP